MAPGGYRVVAWQDAGAEGLEALGLTQEICERAVQWVVPGWEHEQGAAAFAEALMRASAWPWRLVGRLMALPGFGWLLEVVYRLVADNRHRLPGGTPACRLPPDSRPR